MTSISLKDLKAKRDAMTPPACVHEMADFMRDDDATGIVATHNAADVLIEIAEAALAELDAPFEEADAAMQRLLAVLAKIKP